MGDHLTRPLLERDILHAHEHTRSKQEAARFLNVSYSTYKRYAKLYGLFDHFKNKGRPKGSQVKHTYNNISLEKIFNGEYPTYDRTKLKDRLIFAGLLKQQCALCGFKEQRVTDHRTPLTLQYLDGNRLNLQLANLRLICFNCAFLVVGITVLGRYNHHPSQKLIDADIVAVHGDITDELTALQKEIEAELAQDEDAR